MIQHRAVSQLRFGWLLLFLFCMGFEWPGRLAHLQYELKHAPAAARRDVVKRLGAYSADEVREPLLTALEDDDVQVRKAAAGAVARVRLKEAAPLLAAWLGDRDGDVRAAAVTALGALAEPSSREALTRALSDALPLVRREAAGALARVADDDALLSLQTATADADPSVREAAVAALRGRTDGRVLPALSARLTDESPAVRAAAVLTLGSLADARALPLLARAAETEHADVELAAVMALGELGARSDASGAQLLASLRKKLDAEPRVAKAAVAAIGRLRAPAALALLVATLADPELALAAKSALVERTRRNAVSAGEPAEQAQLTAAVAAALEKADSGPVNLIADLIEEVAALLPSESLRPALLKALERGRGDPGRLSRALAATASPEALIPLLERLNALAGTPPTAASSPANSPEKTGEAPASRASRTTPEPPRSTAAEHASGDGGPGAAHPPADAPSSSAANNLAARHTSIFASAGSEHALAAAGTPAAAAGGTAGPRAAADSTTELDRLLDSLITYFAAGRADGRAADPLLAQLTAAHPPATRAKLITLLGWTGATRALPALHSEVGRPELVVQLAAVEAIGRIGSPDSIPTIAPLLHASNADLRLAAARAYAQLAREPELQELLKQLDGDGAADRSSLLVCTGLTLARLRAEHTLSEPTAKLALEILSRFLTSTDLSLSAHALDALRRFGHEGAARIVARELISPKLSRRAAATFALSDIPGDDTRRLLRFVLQRAAPRATISALLALGEIGDQREIGALLKVARFGHWPLPAAATFALRRIAEQPEVKKRALERSLCELTNVRDAHARANVASALAALGGSTCPDFDLRRWYAAGEPSVLRSAAARWLRARAENADTPDPELTQTLAICSSDPDPFVRAACTPAREAPEPVAAQTQSVDIVALGGDGQTLLRQRLIALRLADASVFVGFTDENARVLLSRLPAGPIVLENPAEP
jgi:HEAT repeat protein